MCQPPRFTTTMPSMRAMGASTRPRPARARTGTVDGFLTAMVAVALLLTGCGSSAATPSTTARAGASTTCATAYPGKPTPSTCPPTPSAPTTASRQCIAGDLRVGALRSGAYHGYATQSVELEDVATTGCYLAGAPVVTVHVANGMDEAVPPGQFASARVDLQPGRRALIEMGSLGTCSGLGPGTRRQVSSLTLAFAGGELRVDGSGLDWDVECDQLQMLDFRSVT